MKKKLFTLLAVLLTAITASAYDFEVYGIYYNILDGGEEVEVTHDDKDRTLYSGEGVIPKSVKNNGK